MKRSIATLVVLAAAFCCNTVQASNSLSLASDDVSNFAALDISGDGNGIAIDQTFDQLGGGNHISGSITGDSNGLLGGSFSAPLSAVGLTPGQIVQSGHDNEISLSINGSQNLFAFSQTGNANALTASIIGNNNQAVILQVGTGNVVSFSQTGTGNMLSVVQRSQ